MKRSTEKAALIPPSRLLRKHLADSESALHALSKVSGNSGRYTNQGTAREWLIKQFLQDHLSEHTAIGSGEIFDSAEASSKRRGQCDVVLYRKSFPKISFTNGIGGFLIESVVSHLEVKTRLTKDELRRSIKAAVGIKQLQPQRSGLRNPHAQCYVVAFGTSAKDTQQIFSWLKGIYAEEGLKENQLPVPPPDPQLHHGPRFYTPGVALDGVFVLGKGFLFFDNLPMSFINTNDRRNAPDKPWLREDCELGTLLTLFLRLTDAGNLPVDSAKLECYAGDRVIPYIHLERL